MKEHLNNYKKALNMCIGFDKPEECAKTLVVANELALLRQIIKTNLEKSDLCKKG